ncbi:MAG: hypothetical protein Q7U16_00690 [Agitococcus sp.]|nr:hypothetical protein [Agitococcus sp.]
MNKLHVFLLVPVVFLLGFLFGRFSNDDLHINPSKAEQILTSSHNPTLVEANDLSQLCLHLAEINETNTASTVDVHAANPAELISRYAHTVLTRSTASDIENQLRNVISDKQLTLIKDKKAFSARLIDEYLSPSSTVEPTAEVTVLVSYSNDLAVLAPQNYFSIPKKSSLFIHLQSTPSLLGGNVFVKIFNMQTNKVLLYTAKPISNRQANWVSFEPIEGWSNANYKVVIYTLTDSLQAVGSTEFSVNPQDN